MAILTRTLNALGLMTRAEHEAACRPFRERLFDSEQKRIHWQGEANEANRKFRTAITDLEKQAGQLESLTTANALLTKEVYSLRPDALAMRRKRQMDRDRRKGS